MNTSRGVHRLVLAILTAGVAGGCAADTVVLGSRDGAGEAVVQADGPVSGPDTGPLPADATPGDSLVADSALPPDTGPDSAPDSAPGQLGCGDLLSCDGATDYCRRGVPSTCGGTPMPDAGLCGPDCKSVTCAVGGLQCQCVTNSCEPLPSGCTDCACLAPTLAAGCTCSAVSGGLLVKCLL